MPRASTRFTQADIERAIKGAKAAGMSVGSVEIRSDGTIKVAEKTETSNTASPYDRWKAGKENAGAAQRVE